MLPTLEYESLDIMRMELPPGWRGYGRKNQIDVVVLVPGSVLEKQALFCQLAFHICLGQGRPLVRRKRLFAD